MVRILRVFLAAWRNREELGEDKRPKEQLAFLPGALEIQETPPHPLGRALAWSIVAFFTIGIVWSVFGRVDIVASAEGKIVPSGRTKVIQPLEIGVITAIHVSEGQFVREGEPLIELDGSETGADRHRIIYELRATRLALARKQGFLRLLLAGSAAGEPAFELATPPESSSEERAFHATLLGQEWTQFVARRTALERALAARTAEKRRSEEVVVQLEQTLPLIGKRASALGDLAARQLAAEVQYLELEEQRITQMHTLSAERIRQEELDAAIGEIRAQIAGLDAETHAATLEEVSEKERQIASLVEELDKIEVRHAHRVVHAPIDGTVQELEVTTVGGVVTPAQPLMVIVPKEDDLEVLAALANKDVGFVHEGDIAEIKVHTFPFTQYGVVDAVVTTVSDDALPDDERGLVYAVELEIRASTILVDGRDVDLKPGMSVTAEIKTGQRRLMEFFLAPLLRYGNESVRER